MRIAVAVSISSWVTAAQTGSYVSAFALGSPSGAANVFGGVRGGGTRPTLHQNQTGESHGGLLDVRSASHPGLSFVDDRGTASGADAPENGSAAPPTTTKASGPNVILPRAHVHENAFAGVVKIFVDTVKADFVSPWQVMAPTVLTGYDMGRNAASTMHKQSQMPFPEDAL